MPYEDPDPTDPMTLHGVEIETEDGNAVYEMAECFVEEYTRLGFGADRILRMFRNRSYAGPFMALETLGETAIRELIDEFVQRRGGDRIAPPLDRRTDGSLALNVLE